MSDLTWQVKVLRELLAEAEKRQSEQVGSNSMSFQINKPCIAETRGGKTVFVFRFNDGSTNAYCYGVDGDLYAIDNEVQYQSHMKCDEDIVRVVRLLEEKEILDFQIHGIVPSN